MTTQRVILRNTADHWFVPGDAGQTVAHDDSEFTVVAVTASSSESILTYGLRLIPAMVELTLESADVPVVVQ